MIAIPDTKWGERPLLVVAPKPGQVGLSWQGRMLVVPCEADGASSDGFVQFSRNVAGHASMAASVLASSYAC